MNIEFSFSPFRAGFRPAFVFLMMACGFCVGHLQAQQRFKAGVIAGVTAAQIDGDVSAGYHKIGLQGGLRGIVILKEKQDASVEILFTQRGCRNQPKDFFHEQFNTTLNYIEVPVQWHYKDWLVGDDSDAPDFYRVNVNAGLMYSHLLSYKDKYPENGGIDAALPDLNKESFGWMLGASFFASRHIGFNFRMHRFFTKLYKPRPGTHYELPLREHYLAFQIIYIF